MPSAQGRKQSCCMQAVPSSSYPSVSPVPALFSGSASGSPVPVATESPGNAAKPPIPHLMGRLSSPCMHAWLRFVWNWSSSPGCWPGLSKYGCMHPAVGPHKQDSSRCRNLFPIAVPDTSAGRWMLTQKIHCSGSPAGAAAPNQATTSPVPTPAATPQSTPAATLQPSSTTSNVVPAPPYSSGKQPAYLLLLAHQPPLQVVCVGALLLYLSTASTEWL